MNRFIPFLIALQFLTRLPVSHLLSKVANESEDIYRSDNIAKTLKYYPVIGFIIGVLLTLSVFILQNFAVHHPLYIAVVVSFIWVYLSGGLHLDGVADMADAWVGGLGDKERTLEIMKDPVCGPFGVISIVFVLFFKIVFVYELIQFNPYFVLFAPLISRSGVVLLLITTPYIRSNGVGSDLSKDTEKLKNILSLSLFFILSLFLLNLIVSISISLSIGLVSVIFYILYRKNIIKRVSGVTGDLAGAFIEYLELIILFFLTTFLIATVST